MRLSVYVHVAFYVRYQTDQFTLPTHDRFAYRVERSTLAPYTGEKNALYNRGRAGYSMVAWLGDVVHHGGIDSHLVGDCHRRDITSSDQRQKATLTFMVPRSSAWCRGL